MAMSSSFPIDRQPQAARTPRRGDSTPPRRPGYLGRGAASLTALLIGSTALAGVALPTSVRAGTSQWLGTTSTDWYTPSNWLPAALPTAADDVTVDSTSPHPTVINTGTAYSHQLFVGAIGAGNLAITNGGNLSTFSIGYIGFFANGAGVVTVDGAGSNWSNSVGLNVGYFGSGTLTITNGGVVTSIGAINIGTNAGASGSVVVDGTGSGLGLSSNANLSVGAGGTGTLTITNGGAVADTNAIVGTPAGATGSVLVNGAGSSWVTTNGLQLGAGGQGTLAVSNGGTVTTNNAQIGSSQNPGGSGSASIDGAGSSWTVNILSVGYGTTGSLAVTHGASLTTFSARVGETAGSNGRVTIDGAGSFWTNSAGFDVGWSGTGALTIANGGVVSVNGPIGIGSNSGSQGTVTVDGVGSRFSAPSSDVSIGYSGIGQLTISHGGQADAATATIGNGVGGSGVVTVDGVGSSWTVNGSLNVGFGGTGTLTIANGGLVNAPGNFTVFTNSGGTSALNIGAAPGAPAAGPGTLSTAQVLLGTGGVINFNHTGTNYVFSPDLTGAGAVNQLSGHTILTGNESYIGPTVVSGGTLSVNSSIASSILTTVDTGGTLGGIGTIGNTLVNGGTLAPGNSIGTLTVQGSLVLTSAATYMVEVSATAADKTVVTGSAQLAGKVLVAPSTRIATTTSYTILTSSGTTGTFGSVSVINPALARAQLSYVGNNVVLTLDPGLLSPALPGFSSINQKNVAAGIDNAVLAGVNPPPGFNALFNLSGVQLGNALTQASGEAATGVQQGSFTAMERFLTTMLDRWFGHGGNDPASSAGAMQFGDSARSQGASREAYAAMTAKAPAGAFLSPQPWSVWGAGYGGSQSADGNAVLGSHAISARAIGVAAGADYRISPTTQVGFALGGGGTDFSLSSSLGGGRSDLFQAGAFVRHTIGDTYLAGALAYGWQEVTTDRTVTIAGADRLRGQYNANAFSGRFEVGQRYLTPWAALTPYLAGQFTTLYLPTYGERTIAGADTFALNYAAKDVTAPRSELGLRADRVYALDNSALTLRGQAAWTHDFNTDRNIAATFQSLPQAGFIVNGASQGSDGARVTASAELNWLNGFSLAGGLEGEFTAVSTTLSAKAVGRYRW